MILGFHPLAKKLQKYNIHGRWSGWAIAHPDFGRIEGAAGERWHAALLLAHQVLDGY